MQQLEVAAPHHFPFFDKNPVTSPSPSAGVMTLNPEIRAPGPEP
jgi:hypothetical protein